jgi:hypothetical protein
MNEVQKIEAAEAASLASPNLGLPSRARPRLALPSPAKYYHKLERLLSAMGSLYLLSDILSAIDKGEMQSFVQNNSWIITRIALYPRAKVLEIFAAIGDLDDLLVLYDRQILNFAAEMGAGVIRAYGRKGWLPHAMQRGWRVRARCFVYTKEM